LQIGPIYVYENLIGKRDLAKSTRLEVEVIENGDSQTKTFTLYIGEENNNKDYPPVNLGGIWWAARNTENDPNGGYRFVESPEMAGSLYKWDNGSLGTTEPISPNHYNVWQTEEPCPPGYRMPKAIMNLNSHDMFAPSDMHPLLWPQNLNITKRVEALNNIDGMFFENSSGEEVFFPFVPMILPVEETPYPDYYLYWVGNTEWQDTTIPLKHHTVLDMKYDGTATVSIPSLAGLGGRGWETFGAMELPVRCVYDGDWAADQETISETIINFHDSEAHYYQIRRGHSYDIKGLFLNANNNTYIGVNTQIAPWTVRNQGQRIIR
jgi:hypothetical protein